MKAGEHLFESAQAAHSAGRTEEAEAICRELLHGNPRYVPALLLLGTIWHGRGRFGDAVEQLSRAVELEPHSLGALSRLGSACFAAGDIARAAECFARCTEVDPSCGEAFQQLAKARFALRTSELAAKDAYRALALNPSDHESWNTLGNALRDLGLLEEAVAAYDQALKRCPNSPRFHWNRGRALIKLGRLEEGFHECEWRRHELDARFLSRASWRGVSLPGKTLLLLAEQGAGDLIHFLRYAALARQRVGRVILECHPELRRLFEFSGVGDEVIVTNRTPPAFDVSAPLLSLPALLGASAEPMPVPVPYLRAPRGAPLPQGRDHRLKVGLAWRGNELYEDNRRRSLAFPELRALLETPGVGFFALQLPVPPSDASMLQEAGNVIDLAPRLLDFADTASAIDQLDLVISVDTAVAHLAGALGKPTWTLLHRGCDWRWFVGRTDSPWYPSMTLFRQNRADDWQPVVRRVAEELRRMLAG